MSFLQWSPDLSVGIDFMDADHRKLMELVTELHDLVEGGEAQTAAVEKLDELVDFTQQHFRLEERLMEQNDYDGFEQHRQGHELLLQDVADLRQHLAAEEQSAGPEILLFLKDWLIRHILESDKELGGFLEQRLGRGKRSKHGV